MSVNLKLPPQHNPVHRYRCAMCGSIFSDIRDMVFDINENKVFCYSCAGYSAPLQVIPDPYAPSPAGAELHPEITRKEVLSYMCD